MKKVSLKAVRPTAFENTATPRAAWILGKAELHGPAIDVRDQQNLITVYRSDVVDELYAFGTSLWSASQSYSGQIDSKLSAYLGYSATLVGEEAIGVRPSYVSGMKRGEDIAHPRFWLKLVDVLGVRRKAN